MGWARMITTSISIRLYKRVRGSIVRMMFLLRFFPSLIIFEVPVVRERVDRVINRLNVGKMSI